MRRLLAAGVLLFAGCKDSTYDSTKTHCGPAGECPSGQSCGADGFCHEGGATPPDAAPPDAPVASSPDAQPPVDATPGTHLLGLAFGGTGYGTVDVDLGGGNVQTCAASCTLDLPADATASLTAWPGGRSTFSGWSGDCAGMPNPCPVVLDVDRSVGVAFDLPPFTIQASAVDDQTLAPLGTITFSPPGTSCGPGCATFPGGTLVALHPTAGVAGSWLGGGCEAYAGADCVITNQDATVTASICTADLAVSPTGSDSATGTCGDPFRTVTHALSVAQSGQVVRLFANTYDGAYGETLPFDVPAGVTLLGELLTRGAGVVPTELADAGGPSQSTVYPGDGATLRGLQIVPRNGDAVFLTTAGVTLDRLTITSGATGSVYFSTGSSSGTIRECVLTGNDEAIAFVQGGQNTLVEKCVITGNRIGLELDNSGQDLGGGALGSVGGNVFSCNSQADLWTNQYPTIVAHDDYWDHVPPDSTTDFDANGLPTTLDAANAQLAPSPCP